MKDISMAEILVMHYHTVTAIQKNHATPGLREPGVLDAALRQPFQEIFGEEQYPDPFSKAAVMSFGIINGHPFVDGNKRIGIVAGIVFLEINGYEATASNDAVYDAAYNVASGVWGRDDLRHWFSESFVSTGTGQ